MKQIEKTTSYVMLFLISIFSSVMSFAQEKQIDINLNTNKGTNTNFFSQPWFWVIVALIFILLLVALLRGSGNKNS